jgi:hypothetical protein
MTIGVTVGRSTVTKKSRFSATGDDSDEADDHFPLYSGKGEAAMTSLPRRSRGRQTEASAKIYAAELAEFCATIRRGARNVF